METLAPQGATIATNTTSTDDTAIPLASASEETATVGSTTDLDTIDGVMTEDSIVALRGARVTIVE